jgi:surface protein
MMVMLSANIWMMPQLAFAAPIVAGSFSTTWNTAASESDFASNSDQINFSLGTGGDGETCTGVLYWEEVGNDTNNGTSTLDSNCNDETITFPSPGIYRVDISGTFPTFRLLNDYEKILTVEQWGDNTWEQLRGSFQNAANVILVATDAPDLSLVTDMNSFLSGATNFNSNINHWNVSNVTDMRGMFNGATSFNQPLNSWDVSSVTEFGGGEEGGMFQGASAFNQSLADWDVSSAQDMAGMFQDSGLTSENYSLILNAWAVLPSLQNNVTLGAEGIAYLDTATTARQFLIDTYSWTINDAGLFIEPSNARFITRWDTTLGGDVIEPNNTVQFDIVGDGANFYIDWGDGTIDYYSTAPDTVTYTYATPGIKTITFIGEVPQFYFCYGDDEANKIIDVLQWGTNVWQSFDYAFQECTHITEFSATDAPNLSQVTDMSYMFYNATEFDGDINAWDVSNVENMFDMFFGATSFNQPLDNWDVSNVTDMSGMFVDAVNFNQDLSSWDVSQVASFIDEGNGIFLGTALSTSNYTKILLGWSNLTLQDGAGLGTVGGTYDADLDDYINLTPYCSLAQSARDIITGTYNWDITDGGPVPCKTATYTAGAGGTLTGDTLQYIPDGEGGTAVTAIPQDGYRFVSWSDGSTANPRTDSNLSGDLTFIAIFSDSNSGGSDGTKIGIRAERLLETMKDTPVMGSITTFVASVRDFLEYLTINEAELDKLTPEDQSRLIITLRDILSFLLKLVPGV